MSEIAPLSDAVANLVPEGDVGHTPGLQPLDPVRCRSRDHSARQTRSDPGAPDSRPDQFIEWYAEEGKRIYGETIPTNVGSRRLLTIRQPVGVSAVITPWNFPMAMIARKSSPALTAGCPMLVKPASETPCSALALAELADQASIPSGVFSALPGSPEVVGDELALNPAIRALSFTGSTEIGKHLLAKSAQTVKRVALELGGNAPLIVFDDVDLELALTGYIESKFRNAGQTCVCANRILVQARIHDAYVERLNAAVSSLTVGDDFRPSSQQGPLINESALKKVEEHIEDAVARDAQITVGGSRHELGDAFFEPTVLVELTSDMRLAREETFGPLAPIFGFEAEQEAIDLANDTPFGLAAYFFTTDVSRIWRVGEALDYGVVGINTGLFSYEGSPFGVVKESGIGREGSLYGIEEFLEIKYLCPGGVDG